MNPAAFASPPASACTLGPEGSQGPDRITRNIYDNAGQVRRVVRAYATPLQQDYASYGYGDNGQRTYVIDANGNRADMAYDGHDRLVRWALPAASPNEVRQYEDYAYDANGNRTSLRKRDGTTIAYQYDNLNRLQVKTVPQSATGAAGYSVHYGYDLRNLQTYARFGSATGPGVTNVYDALGRLTSSTTTMDGTARTLTSQYNEAGTRTALSGAFGYTTSFAWDQTGRPTGHGESGYLIGEYGYDAFGRRTSLATGFATMAASRSWGYGSDARVQTLGHNMSGTSADQILGFGSNPASQIVTRTSSNDAYASTSAYPVARGYAVNALNQYTVAGPATFTYDLNGNLTSDGATSYVYDAENRLVSASGAHSATLSYDPLGRLWQVAAPSGTTRFVYDGDHIAIEYDGATGALLRAYVWGPGHDEPLFWYEATGGALRRYFHADHQGSIVAVSDQWGNPLAVTGYDAWGIPNAGGLGFGSGGVGRFGYTGQAWLPELGLYYYKARIYSPTLGRFLQTDPVGYRGGINLYAYVGNDPLNHTDSTGWATDEQIREARRTLTALMGAIRRDISAARENASGTRIRSPSDVFRIQALRSQLRQLERLDPAVVADMRVSPDAATAAGMANAMQGAPAETAFVGHRSRDDSISFGRAAESSRTGDSGRARTGSRSSLVIAGHPHDPGEGRQYPGVGDPGNVLTEGVPMVVLVDGNANTIGWSGSRFTLSNAQGTMPSYRTAPDWIRATFEPW